MDLRKLFQKFAELFQRSFRLQIAYSLCCFYFAYSINTWPIFKAVFSFVGAFYAARAFYTRKAVTGYPPDDELKNK